VHHRTAVARREESVRRYVNARVEEYGIAIADIITGARFSRAAVLRLPHPSVSVNCIYIGRNALQETRGIFCLDTRRWVIYNTRRKVSKHGSIVSRLQSAAFPIVLIQQI